MILCQITTETEKQNTQIKSDKNRQNTESYSFLHIFKFSNSFSIFFFQKHNSQVCRVRRVGGTINPLILFTSALNALLEQIPHTMLFCPFDISNEYMLSLGKIGH